MFATLNEGGLCREALSYWTEKGWLSVAPHTPLLALRGEALHRGVGLREFCGGQPPVQAEEPPAAGYETAAKGESKNHEHP